MCTGRRHGDGRRISGLVAGMWGQVKALSDSFLLLLSLGMRSKIIHQGEAEELWKFEDGLKDMKSPCSRRAERKPPEEMQERPRAPGAAWGILVRTLCVSV